MPTHNYNIFKINMNTPFLFESKLFSSWLNSGEGKCLTLKMSTNQTLLFTAGSYLDQAYFQTTTLDSGYRKFWL